MKHLKNLILVVATAIILILITATIVESSKGTAFVRQHIYTSAWFVVLWAALAVVAAVYIVLRKNKSNVSTSVLLVHASFLVILLGAFTSWNMAESGTIHLRQNETTSTMKDEEGKTKELGFEVSLKNFNVVNYPGTDAPMDYVTTLTANTQEIKVSMNNIGSFNGYRFIQSGYDSDMQGTTLGVYHDPWGIGITYTGYALLFISLIATMASKKTRMRHLYRKALSLQGAKAWAVTALLAVSSFATSANAQEMVKIDGDIADDFGKICVLYNSRITPINTVATSFVTKLCGKPTWDGLSSNQVFAGWIFDVPYWETVKMIEIKEKKAQELLGINGKWASFDDFWDNYNNYKLDAPLKKAYKDGDTKLQKQLRDADEKFNIIRMLYFRSLAGQLHGVGVVHGVSAHQAEGGAQFAGLLHDDGAFSEVGGHEDDLGLFGDQFGELGSEVLVTGAVLEVGHHFATQLLEGAGEEAGQAHGVVVGHVHEHGGLAQAQVLIGIGGGSGTLIGVDEAGAEVVLLALGHQGAGAGGTHAGHLGLFGHFSTGHGQRGTVGTDQGHDLVAFHQALDGVGGFHLVGLVVHHNQFNGAAQHFRHVLQSQLHTFQLELAAKGILTGQGQVHADLDGFSS